MQTGWEKSQIKRFLNNNLIKVRFFAVELNLETWKLLVLQLYILAKVKHILFLKF